MCSQERLLLLSSGAGSYPQGKQGTHLLQQLFEGGIKAPCSSLLSTHIGARLRQQQILEKNGQGSFSMMDVLESMSAV